MVSSILRTEKLCKSQYAGGKWFGIVYFQNAAWENGRRNTQLQCDSRVSGKSDDSIGLIRVIKLYIFILTSRTFVSYNIGYIRKNWQKLLENRNYLHNITFLEEAKTIQKKLYVQRRSWIWNQITKFIYRNCWS